MTVTEHDGTDREGHGEASLGEARSSNPPADPEYLEPDGAPRDGDPDAAETPEDGPDAA